MAQGASQARRFRLPDAGRWAQVVAFLLLLGLLTAMAAGPVTRLFDQRERMSATAAELEELERTNRILADKIERLKDPDYIEQKAREQAGLVRPGEVSVVVMPPSDAQRAERRAERAAKTPPLPPPEPGVLERFADFLGF